MLRARLRRCGTRQGGQRGRADDAVAVEAGALLERLHGGIGTRAERAVRLDGEPEAGELGLHGLDRMDPAGTASRA